MERIGSPYTTAHRSQSTFGLAQRYRSQPCSGVFRSSLALLCRCKELRRSQVLPGCSGPIARKAQTDPLYVPLALLPGFRTSYRSHCLIVFTSNIAHRACVRSASYVSLLASLWRPANAASGNGMISSIARNAHTFSLGRRPHLSLGLLMVFRSHGNTGCSGSVARKPRPDPYDLPLREIRPQRRRCSKSRGPPPGHGGGRFFRAGSPAGRTACYQSRTVSPNPRRQPSYRDCRCGF